MMLSSYLLSGLAALVSSASASAVLPRSTSNSIEARQNNGDCIQVSVTFSELRSTQWGESLSVVGNTPELGNWNTSQAAFLSASVDYSESNPLWSGTVNFPPGTSFQYKYILFQTDGTVVWEADPNHSFTVPNNCNSNPAVSNTWQSVTGATPTSAVPASTVSAAPSSTCTNGPTSRSCWSGGFSLDTDFDTKWPTTGRTVSYDWTITNTTMAPDGHERLVFAINGQYPGPTVEANWGDMISITVHNEMQDNATSIHWHGVRQWHKNTVDGVPGLTECPIAPGQQKTYTFQATQYGTSWYHSHFSCQYGDGLVGPIVIHGPATADYDIELGPLPITDWYYPTVNLHASRAEHFNGNPPEADNALINGTMTSPEGGQYARTTLTAGKRHRLRLVNTAVDNHFVVSFDNHQMEVIAADFVPVQPWNTTNLFLGIGQRYDVIITADQAPGAYWFRADVQDQAGCGTNFNNGNIRAIFSYQGHETEQPISTAQSYTQRCTDEKDIQPYWNSYVPDGEIASSVVPLTTWLNQTDNGDGTITLYWNVNGTSLNAEWQKPTLAYVKDGETDYPARSNLINLPEEGQWTYWVINSVAGNPYDVEVPHPIHLHGHDFYVLGTGINDHWSPDKAADLNYHNPTRRDTAMLPSGGWLAIAFQTDNPGAWVMHCHIAWHADEGLAVQFLESASQMSSVDPIGQDFDDQCAAWDAYQPTAYYKKHDSGI